MIAHLAVQLLGRPLAWRIGRALYLIARDESGNAIETNGEAALIRAVVAANRDADRLRFWDVGGNVGDWSAVAQATAVAAGRPYAIDIFEPAPGSGDRLAARFSDDPAIAIHRTALADAPGTGLFQIMSPTGGTNGLVSGEAATADAIEVPVDTGDAVRARAGNPALQLVKIDAEGHDLTILRGLRETLAAGAAECVQFEYNSCWIATGASLHQVFAFIAELPYVLATVGASGFDIVPGWNAEADRYFETNYVLIRNDRIAAIGARPCVWNASNVLVPAH